MIIVQLTGGLGNQLFQYAMGRTLSLRHNVALKLDLSFFKTYEWHEYSLHPFCIKEVIATSDEVEKMRRDESSLLSRIKRKLDPRASLFVQESSLLFNPEYKKITPPRYLEGYWQSEQYFLEQEALLRKEFEPISAPSAPNQEMLNKVKSGTAVTLHIRRGNFVNVDFVNKVHGTSSREYYEAAMHYVAERCTDPVFYIFSDDMAWVRDNFPIPYRHVFVDINDAKTDFEDLRLMYNCDHHILANSTFSWWGAWLNPHKDKIVIAPKIWFADPEKNKESATIIPSEWIRM